jgi:hypothetical protein
MTDFTLYNWSSLLLIFFGLFRLNYGHCLYDMLFRLNCYTIFCSFMWFQYWYAYDIYRVHLYCEIKRFLVRILVFIVKEKFICKCDVCEWSCSWHLSSSFGLLFTVWLYFYSTLISYHSISTVRYFISFFWLSPSTVKTSILKSPATTLKKH